MHNPICHFVIDYLLVLLCTWREGACSTTSDQMHHEQEGSQAVNIEPAHSSSIILPMLEILCPWQLVLLELFQSDGGQAGKRAKQASLKREFRHNSRRKAFLIYEKRTLGRTGSQQPVCGTSLHIREGQALAPCMSVGQWTGGVCRRHGSVTLLGWNSRCLRAGGMTVRMQTWCGVKCCTKYNTGSAKGLRMSGIWAWNPLPFAEMRGEASRGHPGRRGSVQSTASRSHALRCQICTAVRCLAQMGSDRLEKAVGRS